MIISTATRTFDKTQQSFKIQLVTQEKEEATVEN